MDGWMDERRTGVFLSKMFGAYDVCIISGNRQSDRLRWMNGWMNG